MKIILAAFVVVLLTAALMIMAPAPINPGEWEPAPNPGLQGEFSPNTELAAATRLLTGVGVGPESITRSDSGLLYTGFEDGRIIRFTPGGKHEVFANTRGRPLGMKFDSQGRLIVADAMRGLLSVSSQGEVSTLAHRVEGRQMLLVNDLDIASDGTIWFSDASMRFGMHDFYLDLLEGSATGRLLSYDPDNGEVTVHLQDLYFANGVALGPDERYVLVCETGRGTIRRLWLKGAKAGTSDRFHPGLPGHPDNVTFNGRDIFWLALPNYRDPRLDALADYPKLRGQLARILAKLPPPATEGFVLGLDLEGRVIHNLQGGAEGFTEITSALQVDDTLFLGSHRQKTAAQFPLR